MAPIIGKPAPAFKADAVVNGEIKTISLDDFKGKYLVLFFYPLDFTFVCPTEIVAFSDRVDEFKAINAEIVGASVDSKFTHLAFINTPRNKGGLGGVKYPLLSDLSKSIAKDYGVLIEDGDDAGVTLRGLFIISPTGILRQITINDLPVGRSVDETLRLIRAFQFTDEHGEVCPANWTPGAKTMKTVFGGEDLISVLTSMGPKETAADKTEEPAATTEPASAKKRKAADSAPTPSPGRARRTKQG